MTGSPVQIFPWQRSFLADLKVFLNRISHGRPGSVLLVTPHKRPWRYLTRLYANDGYTGLLPRFLSLAEAITLWRTRISDTSLHMAGSLDQVDALHACVLRLAQDDQRLATRFAHMEMSCFLPWGLRLASLYEEMLFQGITAEDMAHVEVEVAQPAADLLSALGRIGNAYIEELHQRGWTTPGLDAHTVATNDSPIPSFFQPGSERPVVMAGFAMLRGCEDALLHKLWQAGGYLCLHADPALVEGTGYHWSCNILADTLRRWKAKAELVVQPIAHELEHRPSVFFFVGYDCHSQLQALRSTLLSMPPQESMSTVVALVDNSLLMPVLHHLPDKNVNISMGYPLERSPLNLLLEAVLQLCEKRTEDGRYYWRNLLQCLHHPYLNMLGIKGEQGIPTHLRKTLRRLEKSIRRGSRFVHWDSLMDECSHELSQEVVTLLDGIYEHVLQRPCTASNLDEMGTWILDFCNFLLRNGNDMWRRFPLDAEAMYRLVRHTVPRLRQNCLAHKSFPISTLYNIVRQILHEERVPFEAEPLMGLQVMGMLETRLLHFDRVFIVDATDDKLPGKPAQDPLLPDSLRQNLGLPNVYGREQTVAYTVYRLCAGAKEVHFSWQEGITRSSLFDGKKNRSRFVEQLIWQEEQRRGDLLSPGQPPLMTAKCSVRPVPATIARLERAPALDRAMGRILTGELSATLLDTYLQCPMRFVRQYLCQLKPLHEVNENDDPIAVGNCIHEALRMMFEPYLEKELHQGDISRETMQACFSEAFEKAELRQKLPPGSCLMLEETAPVRLWRFLQNQHTPTRIMALEENLKAILTLGVHKYAFCGRLDRLERREGLIYILDYKTGYIKKFHQKLWKDALFFQHIEELCTHFPDNGRPTGSELATLDVVFKEIRERVPSVQLPCYMAMAHAANFSPLGDAALVELRENGKEYSLFGNMDQEERQKALHFCTLFLCVIVLHMRHMPWFSALPSEYCGCCSYASMCNI